MILKIESIIERIKTCKNPLYPTVQEKNMILINNRTWSGKRNRKWWKDYSSWIGCHDTLANYD